MAKRYKSNTTGQSRSHQKEKNKSQVKINKTKILIFVVVIVILIAMFFIINNIKSSSTSNEVRIRNSEKNISSDIFQLNDLNNEVIEHIEKNNMKLVRAHYKLENLENGKIILYYKVGEQELFQVDIYINRKKIEKVEKIDNSEILSLEEIGDNINRDIKKYFTDNQKRLKPEEGKNILNIIVSNTEIIINASEN